MSAWCQDRGGGGKQDEKEKQMRRKKKQLRHQKQILQRERNPGRGIKAERRIGGEEGAREQQRG